MTESAPGAAEAPTCPRHPGRVSYVRCQRCERPTCPECQVPAPVGVQCVECSRAEAKAVHGGVVKRARRAAGPTPVTWALIAANLVFFGIGQLVGGYEWQFRFGFIPVLAEVEPWRWVTSGFVHAGLLHVGINMYMLYQFGSQLERLLGPLRFAALYFVSLLGGSFVIDMLANEGEIHVGASGAIFGLFAAFGVVLFRRRLPWQSIALTAGLWIAAGFLVSGISWQGHIGGALGGLVAIAAIIWLDKGKSRL